MPRRKPTTPSPEIPSHPGRPRFEVDPPARLVQCLRQAFPGFTPTDRWWADVEMKVKTTYWMNHLDPGEHDAFLRDYPGLTADQLVRVLQVEGMIPSPPVDEYHRLAESLSLAARRVLACLFKFDATMKSDKMRGPDILDETGLSYDQVRRVMQKELRDVNPSLFESTPGCEGGYWLTPEGKLVAACIDQKVLPAPRVVPEQTRNRRSLRA